ncbi:MAG: hypothetical protein J5545_02860 [Bacteroidaceae bacterium]|nr:hypothetical protein [Bacteroidaceae bacterium]
MRKIYNSPDITIVRIVNSQSFLTTSGVTSEIGIDFGGIPIGPEMPIPEIKQFDFSAYEAAWGEFQ